MSQTYNTVFISYRRFNSAHARLLYNELTLHGYDCFLDYETLGTGEFPIQIEANIRMRAHFLVVLTPSALQNCVNEGDWLRREIELAIDSDRNIIPLIFDGFDFDDAREKGFLPGDKLPKLPDHQGLRVPWDFYTEAIARLVGERYLQKPLDIVLTPMSHEIQAQTQTTKSVLEELPAPTEAELTAEEYFERGVSAQRAGKLERAIRNYSKAIELNDEMASAYNNRGIAHRQNGDNRAAINDFNRAIQLQPDFPDGYHNRGVAHRANGNAVAATADFARACFRRGKINQEGGDLAAAIHEYTQSIQHKADDATVYVNRGTLYFQQDEMEKAREDFKIARDLQPNDPTAVAGLAIAQHVLNQTEEAQMLWLELLKQDPEFRQIDTLQTKLNWSGSLIEMASQLIASLDGA